MNNVIAVKTEKLTKAFSGVEVIKNCSLTVRQGTIYGFLGANGAGKTTVFKMLLGLLNPTAGKAEVLGMNVVTQREKVLRKVGSLIETPVFYDHLSAEENLRLHLAYMGMPEENVSEMLKRVGLPNTERQLVSKFSLGMRQRLGIARALIHEPINGLDPVGIHEMRELFLDLVRNHGITILMTSHILSEVEYIADTIGILVQGVVKRELSLDQIKEEFPSGLEQYFLNGGNGIA
ncbi:UNVERIFIED_CONTAM: ABC-2 type transport system ATP-binding protein [Paenibacillus sp. PvR008]